MQTVTLGRSDLKVSAVSLGTMTFANQTPENDAHRQLDLALDHGITLIDCAEMYPVNPVRSETAGFSEVILGNWLAKSGKRDQVQLATKATGPNRQDIRGGEGFSGANIKAIFDDSLRRLQTDHIDLYQLHWPDRGSYHFRQMWDYRPQFDKAQVLDHMAGVLQALQDLVQAGKLRAFGLSNETAWGTARWIDVAERMGGPRVVSVQNEYSLLCRIYDTDMAETSVAEGVTLLSYSILAAGLLTGKYQGDVRPDGSRAAVNLGWGGKGNLDGRITQNALKAVGAYHDLARKHGLDPIHMALAWQLTRPFHVVPILGATTVDQLAHQLPAFDAPLPPEIVAEIDALHHEWGLPY